MGGLSRWNLRLKWFWLVKTATAAKLKTTRYGRYVVDPFHRLTLMVYNRTAGLPLKQPRPSDRTSVSFEVEKRGERCRGSNSFSRSLWSHHCLDSISLTKTSKRIGREIVTNPVHIHSSLSCEITGQGSDRGLRAHIIYELNQDHRLKALSSGHTPPTNHNLDIFPSSFLRSASR